MDSFLETLNRPADAFRHKNKRVSWLLVTLTILINTVFESVLQMTAGAGHPALNLFRILRTSVLGFITYFVICVVFWLVCKCFSSKTSLSTYIQTWGLSYFPTILCSIVVAFTEVFFYIFWNNTVLGMILNIVFVGILIWKTVLYVIFLQEVAGLKRGRMIGAFIVIAIFILIVAAFNGYVGLKTPVL